MVTFEVNDMTCGHCVSAITKAVAFVDAGAKVQVDLASHRVRIEPTASTEAVLADAIKIAGFTPVALAGPAAADSATHPAPRNGCCCGSSRNASVVELLAQPVFQIQAWRDALH